MDFRKQIINQFSNIFQSNGQKSKDNGFGWFAILDTLAGGNVLNYDKVATSELNMCLMKLSLDAHKHNEQRLEAKKREAQNKARR
ncbi:MAG: hypothetical protein Unbinned3205contig1001_43 [Prokaryotic dsDNA virus sp.]|nr:MAG: hypothetical protein Unbinned3205contig1001_43 [Prokaryotic dsDNA virus sp.]